MSTRELGCNIRQAELVDALADQLEASWRMGLKPKFADFLSEVPGEIRQFLLYELAKVDVEYRMKHNPALKFRGYLAEVSELRELNQLQLGHIRQKMHDFAKGAKTRGIERYGRPHRPVSRQTGKEPPAIRIPETAGIEHTTDSPATEPFSPQTDFGIPGRIIGRYEIIDQIGSGAFGRVFRAHDSRLNRDVAIKIPREGQFLSDSHRDRFVNEARIVAQLNHPTLVAVHDVGQSNGMPYIVTDLVHGQTLEEVIQSGRPGFRESAVIVRELAETLHYAHRRGLVHRDVKPSNIMIDTEGKPRLMDFGLAHSDHSASLTLDGQVIGTPAYMSPEQASGNSQSVDARSDVYGLGAIFYELLTAQKPFLGDTRMLIHQALNDEPRNPRRLDENIPRDLETICLHAMHKSPGRRYQSAELMADDLNRFLACQPILARPISWVERCDKWRRRNPWLAASTSALAFVLLFTALGGIWFSLYMAHSAGEQKRLRLEEQAARQLAQEELSRSLAANGILRLQNKDSGGLLDLIGSIHACPGNPSLINSRTRLANAWIDEVDGQLGGLVGQSDPLEKACFCLDQSRILTVAWGDKFRVWDAVTFQPLTDEIPHGDGQHLWDAWISGDGLYVVSVGSLGQIKVWSVDSQNLVASAHPGHEGSVARSEQAAINPAGDLVAFLVNGEDKNLTTVRLLRIPGLDEVRAMEIPGQVSQIRFSPSGDSLAIVDSQATLSRVEIADGSVRWSQATGNALPLLMDFGPDSDRIATASLEDLNGATGEDLVCVRDWTNGELVTEPLQHNEDVKAIRFSPNGKLLATASFDSRVRLWDLSDGKLKIPPIVHEGPVLAIGFSPDGSLLATGGFETDVTLWSAESGERHPSMMQHFGQVKSLEFSRDGKRLLSSSRDCSARIWNIEPDSANAMVLTHVDRVWSVDFSKDGKLLAAIAENGTVRIWETDHPEKAPRQFELGTRSSILARFSPTGSNLLTASHFRMGLWEYESPKQEFREWPILEVYRGMEFSPDGSWLVCGSDAPFAEVLRTDASIVQRTRLPHPKAVQAVAIHPEGSFFATACDDGIVRIWDAKTLSLHRELPDQQCPIKAIAFCPDGRLLATASSDLSVRFWSLPDCKPTHHVIRLQSVAQSIAFHPNGNVLTASLASGEVLLWDVNTGLPCGVPLRHETFSPSVRFSPDGRWLASGSFDHTVFCRELPEWIGDTNVEATETRVQKLIGAKIGNSGNEETLSWEQWQAIDRVPKQIPGQ